MKNKIIDIVKITVVVISTFLAVVMAIGSSWLLMFLFSIPLILYLIFKSKAVRKKSNQKKHIKEVSEKYVALYSEKYNHSDPGRRELSIKWARRVVDNFELFTVFDAETTGTGKDDVVIQIGIAELDKQVLFNKLIKPSKGKLISYEATDIHGIDAEMLKVENTLSYHFETIENVLSGKRVLIYNSEFILRLIDQTIKQDKAKYFPSLRNDNTTCVMEKYIQFAGGSNGYGGDYSFKKLPGVTHNAIDDCFAIIELIRLMANSETVQEFYEKNDNI